MAVSNPETVVELEDFVVIVISDGNPVQDACAGHVANRSAKEFSGP